MYGDLICGDKQKYDFYESDTAAAAKIKRAISTLGCYQDNFVVVNLSQDIDNSEGLMFFQVIHCFGFDKTHLYHIEVRINVKAQDGIKAKLFSTEADKKQTLAVFDFVCVNRQMPDFSSWNDITDIAFGKEYDEKQARKKKRSKFYNNYFCNHDGEAEWAPQYKKLSKDAWEEYGSEYTEYLTEDYEKYGKYGLIKEMFFKRNSDPVLACIMGDIEYNGYLGKPDYKKAFEYYSHSSKRGYLKARYKLALMYKNGAYVQQSYKNYVKLIRSGYKDMVNERGESLAMLCAGEYMLEFSRIEQESGNVEKSLNYLFKFYANQRDFIDFMDLSELIGIKKQIYSIQPFDETDMDLFDVMYILRNPVKVRLVIKHKSYYMETFTDRGRKVTKFKDKYYRNPIDLFKNGKIAGVPIKNLYGLVDYAEVL